MAESLEDRVRNIVDAFNRHDFATAASKGTASKSWTLDSRPVSHSERWSSP
jgi:hypothetical protein